MSYEKAKSITIRKGVITIDSTCNNDTCGYSKWTFNGSEFDLYSTIMEGSIQPLKSANQGTWYYAKEKLSQYWKDNNLDSYEIYKAKEYNKYFDLWNKYLSEAKTNNKKKFIIEIDGYKYLDKLNRRTLSYIQNKNRATKFNFANAYNNLEQIKSNYNGLNAQLIEVT